MYSSCDACAIISVSLNSYSTSHVYSYIFELNSGVNVHPLTSNVLKFNLLSSSVNLVTITLYSFTTPLSLVTVITTSFLPSTKLSGILSTTIEFSASFS